MSRKIKYEDEPLGRYEVIEDFLPSPEELAYREDTVKVTIALSRSSIEFFKSQAARHDVAYQKMIRRLLDSYVERAVRLSARDAGGKP
ncbi:MAG: hypothetical protein WD078_10200 [Woeseia sp.]